MDVLDVNGVFEDVCGIILQFLDLDDLLTVRLISTFFLSLIKVCYPDLFMMCLSKREYGPYAHLFDSNKLEGFMTALELDESPAILWSDVTRYEIEMYIDKIGGVDRLIEKYNQLVKGTQYDDLFIEVMLIYGNVDIISGIWDHGITNDQLFTDQMSGDLLLVVSCYNSIGKNFKLSTNFEDDFDRLYHDDKLLGSDCGYIFTGKEELKSPCDANAINFCNTEEQLMRFLEIIPIDDIEYAFDRILTIKDVSVDTIRSVLEKVDELKYAIDYGTIKILIQNDRPDILRYLDDVGLISSFDIENVGDLIYLSRAVRCKKFRPSKQLYKAPETSTSVFKQLFELSKKTGTLDRAKLIKAVITAGSADQIRILLRDEEYQNGIKLSPEWFTQ